MKYANNLKAIQTAAKTGDSGCENENCRKPLAKESAEG